MSKKFLVDAAERIGWTFVQAAGASVLVAGGFDIDVWKTAAVAGGLAAIKVLIALKIGSSDSAATLPK